MVLHHQLENMLVPVDSMTRCTTDDVVETAISRLASSHDAILVFDAVAPESFAGVFASHDPAGEVPHPHNAKVGNFLIVPPRLYPSDTIQDALAALVEHRINLIPVRDPSDDSRLVGVVTVAEIMRLVHDDRDTVRDLAATIRPHTPITAPVSSTVGEVISLMSDHQISRVVLVSDTGVLAGIVSRRDIAGGLVRPNDRQRFSTRDGSPFGYSFDTEKSEFSDKPVTAFAQTRVTTVSNTSPVIQAVNIVLEQQQSSVVLVDQLNRPSGFLSRRDVLVAMLNLDERSRMPVQFRHPDIQVSPAEQMRLDAVAQGWATKLNRRMPISEISISYGIAKTAQGRVKEIETTMIVDPAAGPSSESLVAKAKTRGWLEGLHQTMRMVDTQMQRRN